MRLQYVAIWFVYVCLIQHGVPYTAIHSSFKVPSHGDWEEQFSWLGWRSKADLFWGSMMIIDDLYGDGSKPWYLVNPKIAGKWMFIPLKMYL